RTGGKRFMFRILLLALAVLAGVLVARTLIYTSANTTAVDAARADPVELDDAAVLAHLGQAVSFRTVSPQPPEPIDRQAFDGFLAWLETTYPEVFGALAVERLGHSLLLTWTGVDPGLAPVLLA